MEALARKEERELILMPRLAPIAAELFRSQTSTWLGWRLTDVNNLRRHRLCRGKRWPAKNLIVDDIQSLKIASVVGVGDEELLFRVGFCQHLYIRGSHGT